MTRESVVQRRFIKSFLLLIPNDFAIISTVAQRHKKDYDFFLNDFYAEHTTATSLI